MTVMMPNSKPRQTRDLTMQLLEKHGVTDKVALLGMRGYYKSTMGDPTKNDRGIYDDAIFLVTPDMYAPFNANVDPSAFRKRIANLKAGLWKYKLGIHGLSKPKNRQYEALVQAAQVTVVRDQVGDDTGWFGINIHRGGYNTTSSLGCQTIYPDQWSYFITSVKQSMATYNQTVIPYLLVEA